VLLKGMNLMSSLDNVINEGLIELDLKAKSKNKVIEELTDLLEKEQKIQSRNEYIAKVYEREATMSTYCGSEVAIPHAISSAVKTPAVCFGRSKGFHWDSADELVRFVFLFAIPEENHDAEHLAIISAIARCSLNPETREVWLKATTEEQVLESLRCSIQKR
jgi:fructose-specific phosphotransferase system IIA component